MHITCAILFTLFGFFFRSGQSTLVYFTLQARAEQIFSDTYALICAYNMMRFGHDVKYLTKCLKCNPTML